MGSDCCDSKLDKMAHIGAKHRRVLLTVLVLNLLMFFCESIASFIAQSNALLGDSLDMLGDAFIYALSIYALNKSLKWKNRAALTKGLVMGLLGTFVVYDGVSKYLGGAEPDAGLVGWMAILAFAVNVTSFVMLYRHRGDDLNMQSTWICSRNDMISNVVVFCSAILVKVFNTNIPDLVAGMAMASLVLVSSFNIIRASLRAQGTQIEAES